MLMLLCLLHRCAGFLGNPHSLQGVPQSVRLPRSPSHLLSATHTAQVVSALLPFIFLPPAPIQAWHLYEPGICIYRVNELYFRFAIFSHALQPCGRWSFKNWAGVDLVLGDSFRGDAGLPWGPSATLRQEPTGLKFHWFHFGSLC